MTTSQNPQPPIPAVDLRIKDYARVRFALNALWERLSPKASVEDHQKLTDAFLSRGMSKSDLQAFARTALQASDSERLKLGSMIAKGFEPEQVFLFVQSTPEERVRLGDAWLKSTGQKGKDLIEQSFARSGAVTNAVLLGVGVASLGSMALGAAVGQQDIVDVGRELAQKVPGSLGDLATGVDVLMGDIGPEGVGTLALMLARAVPFVLKEIIRSPIGPKIEDARQSLHDRVHGVFSRANDQAFEVPGAKVSEAQTLEELAAVPATHLPLLMHLRPTELVAFLSANDEARTSMMRANPPGYEQRVDTIRAITPGRFNEFKSAMQQAVSSWEGKLQDANAVTLEKSMSALRSERAIRRQQTEAMPAERPTFRVPSLG